MSRENNAKNSEKLTFWQKILITGITLIIAIAIIVPHHIHRSNVEQDMDNAVQDLKMIRDFLNTTIAVYKETIESRNKYRDQAMILEAVFIDNSNLPTKKSDLKEYLVNKLNQPIPLTEKEREFIEKIEMFISN
ncbi:MAG: hypothetical protein KAS07_03000 [Candidatus Pacebacteria bacterium]|nr:hypothetical protein [Candidatus Paceibacterota bacterium]